MEVAVILVFVLVLVLSWYFLISRRRNLPPGPRGHPILGHLKEIQSTKKDFFLRLMQYKREYGSIFRLRFGFHPVIVLSTPAAVREALVDKADFTSERPNWMALINKISQNTGLAFNLKTWPYNRKLAMSCMRDFGIGKTSTEQRVHEEIEFMSTEFLKHEGKPFNCQLLLSNVVSNIICGVVFGRRFDYNDQKFESLVTMINANLSSNFLYSIPNVFPFVLSLASLMRKKNPVMERMKEVENIIRAEIADHRQTYDPDNIRDFCDLYIQTEKEDSESKSQLTEFGAFRIIFELFTAGTETTSTTLQWLIVYMMYNQDIQNKCRQEIHYEIGAERLPTLDDRPKLPYVEATLLEVQRIATIDVRSSVPKGVIGIILLEDVEEHITTPKKLSQASMSVPHTATKVIEVGGYTIPKDALVVPFLYGCHHDYEAWGDPENFRPERWLDDDNRIIRHSAFMPFSLGRRACAGENLAKMEIFLFGAALLQRFSFKMASTRPNIVPLHSITLTVEPFEVIIDSCT